MKTQNLYKKFDEIPFMLSAKDIASILNVSSGKSYQIMHSSGFPTAYVGEKTLRVCKDKFFAWLQKQEIFNFDDDYPIPNSSYGIPYYAKKGGIVNE